MSFMFVSVIFALAMNNINGTVWKTNFTFDFVITPLVRRAETPDELPAYG